jgi:hypothetical protein
MIEALPGLEEVVMTPEKQVLVGVIVAAIFGAGFAVYWLFGILEEKNVEATGKPFFAAIAQAHIAMYSRGTTDSAAQVLISFDKDIPNLETYLKELASRALAVSRTVRVGKDKVSDVDAALAVLDTRYQPRKRTLLPSEFTGGHAVYCAYVMLRRKYLPEGRLTKPWIACKAIPGSSGRLVMTSDAELEREQERGKS